MYDFNKPLHFGKYKGFTIKEIYCGQKNISQSFLNDFLNLKLKNAEFELTDYTKDLTKKNVVKVKVKNFEILINNELQFDLVFIYIKSVNIPDHDSISKSALDWINWDLVLDDRSEAKDIFESPNAIISKISESNSSSYSLSSDARYISWCIANLDTFFINPEDLISLEKENCYHFYGVGLLKVNNKIYQYSVNLVSTTFKFTDEIIRLNNKKFNNYLHSHKSEDSNRKQSPDYSHIDDLQYPDGFGGYHDNNLIDDAFEGDPDNYWNID